LNVLLSALAFDAKIDNFSRGKVNYVARFELKLPPRDCYSSMLLLLLHNSFVISDQFRLLYVLVSYIICILLHVLWRAEVNFM
jgi:hypothetical protein